VKLIVFSFAEDQLDLNVDLKPVLCFKFVEDIKDDSLFWIKTMLSSSTDSL